MSCHATISRVGLCLTALLISGSASSLREPAPSAMAGQPQDQPQREGRNERFSVANLPPVVVRTVPAAGDTAVDPELKEIRVTFSKAMKPDSYSFAQWSDDSFPKLTAERPQYDQASRTYVLAVELKPETNYVLRLNFAPFDNFMDEGGRKAVPYLLAFETGKAEQKAAAD